MSTIRQEVWVVSEKLIQDEQRMTRMETEIINIKELILDVREDIRNQNDSFVPRNEISVMFEQRDKEIATLQEDMKDKRKLLPAWISSIVSVIAIAIAYFKG